MSEANQSNLAWKANKNKITKKRPQTRAAPVGVKHRQTGQVDPMGVLGRSITATGSAQAQADQLAASPLQRAQQQSLVGQLGRVQGNRHLGRVMGALKRSVVQREGDEPSNQETEPAEANPSQPQNMTETTVPVPEEQRSQVAEAGETAAQPPETTPPTSGEQAAQPPPVPEQAKIRIPVELNFDLLPPELKIRLFNELNFTATVTAARLAWEHNRLKLGMDYSYGGPLSGTARYQTGVGTLSGAASYDPSSGVGSFGAGFHQGAWRAGAGGNTTGAFNASLSYGRQLPPMADAFGTSMMAGEQGMRNLLGTVPGILDDPATAPSVLGEHSSDIEAVSGAAKNVGRLIDLSKQDTSHINWGFYIRATYSQQVGFGVMGGAGVFFKRDETASTPE